MADTRGRQAVKITDPTTGANEARVTAAGNVGVDIGASITLTVDTELNAAAALADAASATVSTASVGGVNLLMNATTLDRQRAINASSDSTGIGIAAAGLVGQLDDAATTAVTENQYAPVRISTRRALLVEGVASGTNLNVNLAASGVTVTVDTELNTAAALADTASATVSTATVGAVPLLMNATTLDRARSVLTAMDTVATGIAASGMVAQLDDAATGTVTENQFGVVRMSTRRALLVEGVASGTNLNVNLAASAATVTVDTELPAAAALGDALSATTSTTTLAAVQMVNNAGTLVRALSASGDALTTNLTAASSLAAMNATTTDRLRTTTAYDGNGAITTTGVLGVGVGPGFSRRFNPSNLGTANNSASTIDTNGAGTVGVQVGTSTTGTYVLEATNDGTTWVALPAINSVTGASVQGSSLTPTVGDMFVAGVNGYRQFRLRTNSTLGATMAHVLTLTSGDELSKVSAGSVVDTELPAAASLADNTANPSVPGVGAYLMAYDGTDWDRVRLSGSLGSLNVALAASSATVTVDSELPAAAALGDALSATTSTTTVGAVAMVNNAGTLNRVITPGGDAQANTGVLAAGLIGYNGATYDRVRVANTGRLQVDVITGGGVDTPTNPVTAYFTSASLAAGASTTTQLQTSEAASKKLRAVDVWASVPFKAAIQVVTNAVNGANLAVGGGQAAQSWQWRAPNKNFIVTTTTAGLDAFACIVTNLDNNTSADVYCTFYYED